MEEGISQIGMEEAISQIGMEEVISQIGMEEVAAINQIGMEEVISQIGMEEVISQIGMEEVAAIRQVGVAAISQIGMEEVRQSQGATSWTETRDCQRSWPSTAVDHLPLAFKWDLQMLQMPCAPASRLFMPRHPTAVYGSAIRQVERTRQQQILSGHQ